MSRLQSAGGGMLKRLWLLLALLCVPTALFATNPLTIGAGACTLLTTFDNISYTCVYTNDDNNTSSAVVEYKRTADTAWKTAYAPYHDTRGLTSHNKEFRGSIVGLTDSTSYDVRVTFSDATDGVNGAGSNPFTVSGSTLDPTPTLGGSTLSVTNDATLATALSTANPGDTISMAAGTYAAFTMSRSGNSGAWIKITPASGTVNISSGGASPNILVSGSYVIIDGLTLPSSATGGIQVSGNFVFVQNNTLSNISTDCDNTGATYSEYGIWLAGNDNYAIGNTIHSTALANASCTTAPTYQNSPTICIVWSTGHTRVAKNNTIDAACRDSISSDNGSTANENDDIVGNTLSNFKDDGAESKGDNVNVRIYSNTINISSSGDATAGYGNSCIAVQPAGDANAYGPVYIFRNYCKVTVAGNVGQAIYKLNSNAPTYIFHNTTTAYDAPVNFDTYYRGGIRSVVYNNIALTLNGNAFSGGGTGTVADYNVFFQQTGTNDWAYMWNDTTTYHSQTDFFNNTGNDNPAHSKNVNPGLDASLHIDVTSQAYNAGVILANFNTTDSIWGYTSTGPDIGAYEVGGFATGFALTQYAYRWKNDDGSESTATFAEAENTALGIATNTIARLRVGVDASGSPGAQSYKLEAKLSTDSTYQAVPQTTPSQTNESFTTAGSGSGTIPAWVTSLQIECIGGGGAGSRSATGGQGRGGGAGGTYAIKNSLSVTPGASYTYVVGAGGTSGTSPANGGLSSFTYGGTDYCVASGGVSASADTSAGATASTSGSVGDTITAGSNGSTGNTTNSGAGGAGAGTAGGAGGAAVSGDSAGNAGSSYGGGGSGGRATTPTITTNFTSSQSWTRPSAVTTITSAQCWGPGGNGGNDSSSAGTPGGGGGGAYAIRSNITVGNFSSYTVNVGTSSGNNSSFTGDNAGCVAGSGSNATNDGAAGAGGSSGTGDTVRNGGAGGTGGSSSGGGGEGGCSTANGHAASGATAGTGCDGGDGGTGVSGNSNGNVGSAPGGGGSGGHRNSGAVRTGGAGARGQVTLTYDDPSAANPRDGGAGASGLVKITYTPAAPIALAASANIASGGNVATSAQLTAPSGKTTASFDAGKISDDTNPPASVTVAADHYTELEYALKMIAANVSNGNSYNLRVTKNGTALDTYSVTPTITASGSTVTIETAANGSGSAVNTATVEGGALGTTTVYSVCRTGGVFDSNCAATWSLTNKTGGVVDGDLAPAGDTKSAVFTGNALGTATIHAINGSLSDDTGTITVSDTTGPTAGNSGTITTSGVTSSSITLNWTKATDAVTAQASLQYIVYRSSSNNINNITNAEANGIVQMAYTADVNSFVVTGPQITPSTQFYFAVVVKDGAGNKTFYSTINETTLANSAVDGNGVSRLSIH